tara:strand:- start:476 stop:1360 length:885 start_codon:yes stop_codon:yes gene_type:complete
LKVKITLIQTSKDFKLLLSDHLHPVRRKSLNSIFLGSLEVRLAKSKREVEAAQRLRYRVFYEEMGAVPDHAVSTSKLDIDKRDPEADHLIVFDRHSSRPPYDGASFAVVGTYRLLQKHHLGTQHSFYTAQEFDISKLLNFPGKIMELGRSCVDAKYRNRVTLQLMWQGIASYIFYHKIDLMFGCASFPSPNPYKFSRSLNYLSTYHKAPAAICPRALPERYFDMNCESTETRRKVEDIQELPPLIKGYLRIGAKVGDGAVIDYQFNTTDVCIIVKTDDLPARYRAHYKRKFKIS